MTSWDINKLNIDEYNRQARLANCPPEEKVTIEGVSALPGPDNQQLIRVQVLDHTQSRRSIHMTVPHAMYLFAMLRQVQKELNAEVPLSQPK